MEGLQKLEFAPLDVADFTKHNYLNPLPNFSAQQPIWSYCHGSSAASARSADIT
jgi:hypothetical protein